MKTDNYNALCNDYWLLIKLNFFSLIIVQNVRILTVKKCYQDIFSFISYLSSVNLLV